MRNLDTNPGNQGPDILKILTGKKFFNRTRWTEEETSKFNVALRKYGRDWPKVSECVGTRNPSMCKLQGKKFRILYQEDPSSVDQDIYQLLTPKNFDNRRWSEEEH